MIVTCPQCSSRYKLDPNNVSARGAKITCPRCRYVFVVHADSAGAEVATSATLSHGARREEVAPPKPSASPVASGKRSAEALDFRKVGISSWKVRVKIGLVYDFSDIKTLRKYIQDGRVTPEDVISHDARTWVTIGDIPDLDAYFIQVYDEAEVALNAAAEGAAPKADAFDDDAPTNVVGLGSLGNDLAAEALAQAAAESEAAEASPPPPGSRPPAHQGGPQFVDPFAALKDKQRERIQQRRSAPARPPGGGKPSSKAESGPNLNVLLIAALALVVVGGGLFWWFGQDEPSSGQQTSPLVTGPKGSKAAEQYGEDLKKKIDEELAVEELDDNPIDDAGDPILIPIGPSERERQALQAGTNPGVRPEVTNGGTQATTLASTVDSAGDCKSFVQQRIWGQAKMACKMAVDANPGNPAVKVNYGMALFETGDAGAAKVQLTGASNSGSADPRIDKYLGHIARDFGDVPGASSHYQAYLATNPPDRAAIQAELDKLQGA